MYFKLPKLESAMLAIESAMLESVMLNNSIILSQNKSILYPFIKFLETSEEA